MASAVVEPQLETGTIKSVRPDKFGFVFTATGEEAVFFPSECPLALSLEPGATVQFYTKPSKKGKHAFNVRTPCNHGVVKSYNPLKFGFVLIAEGTEAIFYPSDILPGYTLQVGDTAEFDLKERKGGQQAYNVAKAGVPAASNYRGPAITSMFPSMPHIAAALTPMLHLQNAFNQQSGTVKSFNPQKGFGFIVLPNGEQALVNIANVVGGVPLAAGDSVQLDVQLGPKGKKAFNVTKMAAAFSQKPVYAPMGYSGMSPPTSTGMRETGTVKSYNPSKGYGFIWTQQGDEALVHKEQLQCAGLAPSEIVEYEIVFAGKGKKAVNVTKVPSLRFQPY